jgi:D-alanyl-D-alanine carboxypeptidase
VVSKQDPLPERFVPADLVTLPGSAVAPTAANDRLTRVAAEALLGLFVGAADAGLDIRVVSAYRSYEEQIAVHAQLAARVGAAQAARRSAPPGHSEHQLGTTADVSAASVGWGLSTRFADTAEGTWLREHAHEFGFALSYPADGEAVTGYVFEPWHIRYIGREAAGEWHASGLPLLLFLRAAAAR